MDNQRNKNNSLRQLKKYVDNLDRTKSITTRGNFEKEWRELKEIVEGAKRINKEQKWKEGNLKK